MSKFRFYITDTFDGSIKGTNNASHAKQLAGSEDYFVVDTETGKWLTTTEDVEIEEFIGTEDEEEE